MKKTLIVLSSLAIIGCNTIRTRTLVNYRDTGTHPTPIESYKVEETRYTTRRNKYFFPILRECIGPNVVQGILECWLVIPIVLPFDLLSTMFISPFTTETEHYFSYGAQLVLKVKLVDINNKPLSNYQFQVRFSNQTSTLQTNKDGIFTGTLSVSEARQKKIPIVFSFPDSKLASITYQTPFKSGTRQIVSPTGNYTSSIPAQGKVLVLDLDIKSKSQKTQTKKTKKQRR